MEKSMETLDSTGMKPFVLAALKVAKLVVNIFRYSFVSLRCVVPV